MIRPAACAPALATFLIAATLADAQDTWSPATTSGAPEGRYSHTAVWTGREMIVWGGSDSASGNLNTGGRYDPATDSWTATTQTGAPVGRQLHSAVWTGREMIVWGGYTGGALNDGGRYDPITDSWTPVTTANAPGGRNSHPAVWTGREMIVWGGSAGGAFEYDDGGRYDPATDTWTPIFPMADSRALHSMIWTGREIIALGGDGDALEAGFRYVPGFTGGAPDPSQDSWSYISTAGGPFLRYNHTAVWTGREMIVWGGSPAVQVGNAGSRYDPVTDSWAGMTATNAPAARSFHSGVWTGREMIVWGGNDEQGSNLGTGGRYDPVRNAWTATAPGGDRGGHSTVWTGREMIVWGGNDSGTGASDTGARYRPPDWPADAWTSPPVSPSARQDHTAVWTGREMIVWGGFDGAALGTGARYDPATDQWTAVTTVGAAAARTQHTAVWTGEEMVVWGGSSGAADLNTGGRYDPVADAWSPVAAASAPAARRLHTAVWTGREMIVWGGGTPATASGARYDPKADAWIATQTAGAPAARYRHAAVWTGREMIAWGGFDGAAALDTGARYDPRTDVWAALPSAGAPSARYDHTAVWSGREMIVWGGLAPTDTGGRYDPVADAWTTVATTGAPSGRGRHSAVWTGREMIVWGGFGFAPLGDGGRYDPRDDAWSTVTTTAAPAPRERHTAVWTGREMIVWGGTDGGVLNSGGRYGVPGTDNLAPTLPPIAAGQFEIDGATPVSVGGTIGSEQIVFKVSAADPEGDDWILEIELRPVGTPFQGVANYVSSSTASGAEAAVTTGALAVGAYRWQYRLVDGLGHESLWRSFGANPESEADFVDGNDMPSVVAPIGQHDPDGTPIAVGGTAGTTAVVFKMTASDPEGDKWGFLLEIKLVGTPFTGTGVLWSGWKNSGAEATINSGALPLGAYHWRYAVGNEIPGGSEWGPPLAFGGNADPGDADFVIDKPPDAVAEGTMTQHSAPGGGADAAGFVDDDGSVTFKAVVTDPDGGTVAIQVEVKPLGTAFDGSGIVTGGFVASGGVSQVTVSGLAGGAYRWRARSTDGILSSAWTEFPGDPDFGVAINVPPAAPANPAQLKLDGVTFLAAGGSTDESGALFRAFVSDPNGDPVQLQVEVKPLAVPFAGAPSATGPAGADVLVVGLSDGAYHWQIRAVDTKGATSGWVAGYGFTVIVPGNAPPDPPAGLSQTVTANQVVLSAAVSDADLTTVTLQVEVQPAAVAFAGTVSGSATVPSGSLASTTLGGLGNGSYHWRARAVDPSGGASAWTGDSNFTIAAANVAPNMPAGLEQLRSDGTTALAVGEAVTEGVVLLRAVVSDLDGDAVRLQVEVRPWGSSFLGIPTMTSPLAPGGGAVTLLHTNLAAGTGYVWRARAVDADGAASAWVPFGGSPDYSAGIVVPPDAPTGLGQFTSDGAAPIAPGGTTNETAVHLQAGGGPLEFELKPSSALFDGGGTFWSASGAATIGGLADPGYYRWRVRAATVAGATSAWAEFDPAAIHFVVDAGANAAPDAPAGLKQWKLDGVTSLPMGGSTAEPGVTFSATVSDPNGGSVFLDVEVRPAGQPFLGTAVASSGAAASGSAAVVTVGGLQPGGWHWQVRARDGLGAASAWVAFSGGTDFARVAGGAPGVPAALDQIDGATLLPIAVGGAASGNTIIFKALVSDPDADAVRIEVEVRPAGTPFAGIPSAESGPVQSGTTAQVSIAGLAPGGYRWQARARDAGGAAGPWIAFGGSPDFTIGGGGPGAAGSDSGGACFASRAGGGGRLGPLLAIALLLLAAGRRRGSSVSPRA